MLAGSEIQHLPDHLLTIDVQKQIERATEVFDVQEVPRRRAIPVHAQRLS